MIFTVLCSLSACLFRDEFEVVQPSSQYWPSLTLSLSFLSMKCFNVGLTHGPQGYQFSWRTEVMFELPQFPHVLFCVCFKDVLVFVFLVPQTNHICTLVWESTLTCFPPTKYTKYKLKLHEIRFRYSDCLFCNYSLRLLYIRFQSLHETCSIKELFCYYFYGL